MTRIPRPPWDALVVTTLSEADCNRDENSNMDLIIKTGIIKMKKTTAVSKAERHKCISPGARKYCLNMDSSQHYYALKSNLLLN